MKVLGAEVSIVVNVDTDEKEFPTFRRHSPDCWENLMGESWEGVMYCEELEAAYQEWRKQ